MIIKRHLRAAVLALAVASLGVSFAPAQAAQASPYWCRAWQVSGATWYGYQDNGYDLLFTLRMATATRFSGYARYNRGDVNRGGTPSQFIRGGVNNNGAGSVLMEIQWSNGSRGQYNATTYNVLRTASGGLTAGLRGTTVDVSGGGGAAGFDADGTVSGLGNGDGRYHWPMYCSRANVVRYPA
jgi:hypothetical protein